MFTHLAQSNDDFRDLFSFLHEHFAIPSTIKCFNPTLSKNELLQKVKVNTIKASILQAFYVATSLHQEKNSQSGYIERNKMKLFLYVCRLRNCSLGKRWMKRTMCGSQQVTHTL